MMNILDKISIKGTLFGLAALILSLAIIIIVVWVTRRKNKRTGETIALPKETQWGSSLTEEESATVARIAKALYNDMKGANLTHKDSIYDEFNRLPDRLFVAVANQFAENYGKGESLTQWMRDEAWSWASFQIAGTAKTIISRLEHLGIQ